jgi:hypothetical protein
MRTEARRCGWLLRPRVQGQRLLLWTVSPEFGWWGLTTGNATCGRCVVSHSGCGECGSMRDALCVRVGLALVT